MSGMLRSFLLVVLIVAGIVFVARTVTLNPNVRGAVGVNDVLAFWSGYELAAKGRDPYDAQAIIELQESLGFSGEDPQLYWNPPWTLALLSPILWLGLPGAAQSWFVCNLVFLFLSAYLAHRAFGGSCRSPAWLIAGAIFIPALEVLKGGQLALFMTLGIAVFLWAIERRADIVAGLALIPLSMKPHIVFIFLFVVLAWIVQERRWRILMSASLGFAALLMWTVSIVPSALVGWHPVGYSPTHWKTSTLTTFLRIVFAESDGSVPQWPMLVVPALALCVTLYYCVRRSVDLLRALPASLCGSTFFAPYAWTYDSAILLLIAVYAVTLAGRKGISCQRLVLGGFLTLQAVLFLFRLQVKLLHFYFWIPLAVYLTWLWAERQINKTRQNLAAGPGIYRAG